MNVKTNSFYTQAASSDRQKATDQKQEQKNSKENAKADSLLSAKGRNRV